MICFDASIQVFVSLEPIDFRKGLHGLLALVVSVFNQPAPGPHMFLFRDRTGRKIKVIYWDKNGFILLYKCLSTGKFQFPKLKNGEMQLDRLQFECLLAGMQFIKNNAINTDSYSIFN
jgi:transposase